jgi:hypothetical protein
MPETPIYPTIDIILANVRSLIATNNAREAAELARIKGVVARAFVASITH